MIISTFLNKQSKTNCKCKKNKYSFQKTIIIQNDDFSFSPLSIITLHVKTFLFPLIFIVMGNH